MKDDIDADRTKATYAWALLNGCCDEQTQRQFDALALVPKTDRVLTEREFRNILDMYHNWNDEFQKLGASAHKAFFDRLYS